MYIKFTLQAYREFYFESVYQINVKINDKELDRKFLKRNKRKHDVSVAQKLCKQADALILFFYTAKILSG